MSVVKVDLPGKLSQEVARLVEAKRYKSVEEVLLTALRRLVHHEQAISRALEGQVLPEALTELAEMAVEYAEDYLGELETYAQSPDRASHLPFILKVASLTTDVYDEEDVQKVKALFQRRRS